MRPLSLHTSALSDAEYTLYTSSLADLTLTPNAPHEGEENTRLGVREARAWLWGRYVQVPAPSIDQILRMFSPNLAPEDTMTGGQFFAALSMSMLAFVQAEPRPSVIRTQSNSNNLFHAASSRQTARPCPHGSHPLPRGTGPSSPLSLSTLRSHPSPAETGISYHLDAHEAAGGVGLGWVRSACWRKKRSGRVLLLRTNGVWV
ncbi:hypothetical protein BD779DRAFT_348998 [Infundibulicybe gibba]|nr:hypothetical protein BD779DRAFT_348998 [Infundibulicybe gibba]